MNVHPLKQNRTIVPTLSTAVVISASAASQNPAAEPSALAAAAIRNALPAANPRILIAYFSRFGSTDSPDDIDTSASASVIRKSGAVYGTTEHLARTIQSQTGGQ